MSLNLCGVQSLPYIKLIRVSRDDDDKEMPDIAFKMLTGRDESASGKTAKK